jgi:DNA-binding transcriptional regulator LsrR (DeoR family)
MVHADELSEVKRLGGVGEILGHFFAESGEVVETPLTARTISLSLQDLRGKNIVAIAGGKEKACAIKSALKRGMLSGLITDERTAQTLV